MDTAVIFETNNLSNGSAEAVVSGLERLFRHLAVELASVDDVVVTHDGLSDAEQHRVSEALGRDVKFVTLPLGTGYYAAKNVGFEATTARFVAFADSDCWPAAGVVGCAVCSAAEGARAGRGGTHVLPR